jgi:hypothetical protein
MNPAAVSPRLGGAVRTGEDRLRLLDAIARRGSITAAGEEIGLGFRATWDAVQAPTVAGDHKSLWDNDYQSTSQRPYPANSYLAGQLAPFSCG